MKKQYDKYCFNKNKSGNGKVPKWMYAEVFDNHLEIDLESIHQTRT